MPTNIKRIFPGAAGKMRVALIVALMLAATGCASGLSEIEAEARDIVEQATAIVSPSEPSSEPSESASPESAGELGGGDVLAESRRPDVDPCDGSEELEEVVRYTLPEQFPEGGGQWRGVIAAQNENLNPGPDYCLEDYALGFLQPQEEDGEFNWVVVARTDWDTKTFPTDLECSGGDAVNLTEDPVVEEMLCTTSEGEQADPDTEEYSDPPDSGTGEYIDPPEGGGEASVEQEVGDYYRAAGAEEWAYTYDYLASETRSMFTEDEWFQKNQWLWDRDPVIYHILSIAPYESSGESFAEVELRITAEDGSASTQTAYFVFEDGAWRRLFTDAETDLFMPGTPFDEFIEANGGLPSGGDETGACAGVSDCEVVDTADVDGDGLLDEVAIVSEPDEYSGGTELVTVRVLLADGTTLERDSEVEFWSPPVYHGATDFGQVPGEEIVVGAMTGAHTRYYRVLTYRDGELVELPYPDGDLSGGDTSMWPIDAAASVNMGIECDPSDSTVVLRSVSSVGPGGEGGFEGEETRWVLDGGGEWQMVDSAALSYSDGASAFEEVADWRCGDLPRGYE